MASKESTLKTFLVTLALAVVCSLLVAVSAVGLRARQETNRDLDRKRNILAVAGLYDPDIPIADAFEQIETRLVDLRTGEYSDDPPAATYDQQGALLDAQASDSVPPGEDIAGIARREHYSVVYLVRQDDEVTQIILPVRGQGLWDMMYGFLALDRDLQTVRGITFYQHAETPGLGGEVENPQWQASWANKKVYDEAGMVKIHVVKGVGRADDEIDGISGATLTVNGVTAMMSYWFGDSGFKPYIDRLKRDGVNDD